MIAGVTERASAMWDDGSRWDAILENLRAEGFSKIDCIRATVEVLRLPLADAKRLVHESRAWADRREQDDQWHDALIADSRPRRPADRPDCRRGRSVSMTGRPSEARMGASSSQVTAG
jgi:hypothetical protein